MGPPFELPPWSVTITSGAPQPPLEFAVCPVLDTNLTSAAAAPIVTVAPARNPIPLILTAVPPAAGPSSGVTDSTGGAARYLKAGPPFEGPPWSVTITSGEPEPALVLAVSSVLD